MKYFIFFLLIPLMGCGIQSIPRSANEVEAAWSEVLSQFQRRADLVPNLVAVVKGSAKHERETLEAVVSARARATQTTVDPTNMSAEKLQEFMNAQSGLGQALARLMVVVERYPDLKANQQFRDLQVQLEGTENRITIARRRYIEAVKEFNNLVTVPPTSWTNSLFYKKEKKAQFTVENEEQMKTPPKVEF